MRRYLLVCIMLIICIFVSIEANPQPAAQINYINAFPPEIGIYMYYSIDFSGDTIYTDNGYAIIDSGVVIDDWSDLFIFDSTNTSGFEINHEGDYILFGTELGEYDPPLAAGYGFRGTAPPPLKGHHVDFSDCYFEFREGSEGMSWPILSFSFSMPDWGYTDVVINEINMNNTWHTYQNFIELYNKTDQTVSLANWKLVCDTIYELPPDAEIAPYGFYTVYEDDWPESFDMDFDTDNIYLINPNPDWIVEGNRRVDQIGWSSDHGENVSFMRYPDGNAEHNSPGEHWDYMGFNDNNQGSFIDGFPTPNAPNSTGSPGFFILNAEVISTSDSAIHIGWIDPTWVADYSYSIIKRSSYDYPEYDNGELVYTGTESEFIDSTFTPDEHVYYAVFAINNSGGHSPSSSESNVITFGGDGYYYLPGDANMWAGLWRPMVIGGDVTYLVNYFRGMSTPCLLDGFYAAGDANGDCMVIGSDVTYMVGTFRGLNDFNYCSDYPPFWRDPVDAPAEKPQDWPYCE